MMNEFFYAYQCNDLYGEGSIDGVRYAMVEAADMNDARGWLSSKRRSKGLGGRNIRKIQFKRGDVAEEYPDLPQIARKAIYEGARTKDDLDRLVPGWRGMHKDDDWMNGHDLDAVDAVESDT